MERAFVHVLVRLGYYVTGLEFFEKECLDKELKGHFVLGVGCPRNGKKKFRFEPKQTETRSVLRLFRFVS